MKNLVVALSLAAVTASVFAQDAAEGQKAFQACAACHSTSKGVNGLGPSLFGIVGGKAGSTPGFSYSRAMKSSNLTWTPQNLDAYIANPQGKVPGNHMPFSGMPDAKERAAVIAYLQSLH